MERYQHASLVYRRSFAGALTAVSCQFFGRDTRLNDGVCQVNTSILFPRHLEEWDSIVEAMSVQLFDASSNPINGVLVQLDLLADPQTVIPMKMDFTAGYGNVTWQGFVHSRWALGYVLPAYAFSAGDFLVFTASYLERAYHART